MGPRPDGRGKVIKEWADDVLFALQWGRDPMVAERLIARDRKDNP